MPLANFFDKAALAASHVLHGLDPSAFATELESHVVGILFDASAAKSSEGRVTLELTANLLARLYPRLAIVALEPEGRTLAAELTRQSLAINPLLKISRGVRNLHTAVCVGKTRVPGSSRTVYVGSHGWVARLSPESPVGSGSSTNPFGAAGAACFAAANVFRAIFAASLPHGALDATFALSLFEPEPAAKKPANPPLGPTDLGESHLVGLGAIGNGAAWALGRVAKLSGTLNLIDDEQVDLTNLQRYVLSNQQSVRMSKVALATEALKRTALDIRPHEQIWSQYLTARADWKLERVAVALDSARDRVAVQAALPRWVVNAWTQPGDLGVSRHEFVGDQACLMCIYFPDGKQPDEDQLIAEAIGLPNARMEVRQLLYKRTPVDRSLLERIATALRIPTTSILSFEGKPLRAFYSEAVCGGIILKLTSGATQAPRAEVPMAFQSALAGVLLASELVAHAAGLKSAPPPVTTKINLLRPLAEYLSLPSHKSVSGRCICQDDDYVHAYRAKYPRQHNARL